MARIWGEKKKKKKKDFLLVFSSLYVVKYHIYLVRIIMGVILCSMTRLLRTSGVDGGSCGSESISSAGGTRFENRPPGTQPRLAFPPRGRPAHFIGLCWCVGVFSWVFMCV